MTEKQRLTFRGSITKPRLVSCWLSNVHSTFWNRQEFPDAFVKRCRRAAATICPRPGLQVVTSCTHMDRLPLLYAHVGLPVQPTKAAWWPWPLTFWRWKWCPSQICDVGYLCANFSLPRSLCSRVRPDVYATDRQTSDRQTSDVRQKHRLMPPPIRGGGITDNRPRYGL